MTRRSQAHRADRGHGRGSLLSLAAVSLVLLGIGMAATPVSTATPDASAGTPAAPDSPVPSAAVTPTRPSPTTRSVAATPIPATPAPTPALPSPPPCDFADEPVPDPAYDRWATTLVDTALRLPRDYVPPDLVPIERADVGGWGMVRAFVIDDLRAMAEAARDAGAGFAVQSAYRGFARQAEVHAGWVARNGVAVARRSSARAGHSEHQLGTSLDLRAIGRPEPWDEDFAAGPVGTWLAEHAWSFGFVVSYPPGAADRTCYQPEAWHVRYVGRDVAAAVHAADVPLRVWLAANQP